MFRLKYNILQTVIAEVRVVEIQLRRINPKSTDLRHVTYESKT